MKQMPRQEMKKILGGAGGGTCCAHITSGGCPDCGTGHWTCGLSKQEAKDKANQLAQWLQASSVLYPDMGYGDVHAYWCCASCPQ